MFNGNRRNRNSSHFMMKVKKAGVNENYRSGSFVVRNLNGVALII